MIEFVRALRVGTARVEDFDGATNVGRSLGKRLFILDGVDGGRGGGLAARVEDW